MSNDTWYGVTLMFRLRYYWNNVMSNPTYNVIVIVIGPLPIVCFYCWSLEAAAVNLVSG